MDNQPPDQRTALAEDRTLLAAERTFAAWLRTGLAFLAAGLAAPRLLAGLLGKWPLHGLATALIACAAICFMAGAWRDEWARTRLPAPGFRMLPRALTLGLSLLLSAMSAAAAVLLWLE